MAHAVKGTVTIDDGYGAPVTQDLSKVLVIGVAMDMPREVLAMGETHRLLSALLPEESQRVAAWLYAKFGKHDAGERVP